MEHDLHLNLDKIRINVDSVPFFGQTLTKNGLMIDENKWKVIQDWPIPTNIKELQSFLGSVNYLSKFIPYLSTNRKPLQDLLKHSSVDAEFLWLDTHTEAFIKLKTAICKYVTLKYFDSSLPIYIECDTSKKGIGVVMLQPDSAIENTSKSDVPNNLHPVFYASKTLTDTESNYSNIECEMLGVVFSILHFMHFTFGWKVHVITDHKPLITFFRKNLHATSPRLSGMLVQILDYNIEFHHQEGTKMHLSDALSRLNTHDSDVEKSKAKPVADFNITTHDVEILTGFKSLSLYQIQRKTEHNADMQLLKQHVSDGFPKAKSCLSESIHSFYDYRESLSIVDGVIMKGQRVIILASLRCKTLETLHSSHMGITKTTECARTAVFWPNMQKDIITHLSSYCPCAEFKIKQKPEPLSHDVPMVVWHSSTLDNFEFKGTHYLLVHDRFSQFIAVKKSDSLSARSTIPLLLEIFTEHGVPSSIRCDRSSNFLSSEFNTFCTDLNIHLTYSSAYHHSSNMTEHAVRTIKDLMCRCYSAGVSWRLALIEFLFTPRPDGKSPAELCGHQFKGILPMFPKVNEHDSDLFSERKEKEKKNF